MMRPSSARQARPTIPPRGGLAPPSASYGGALSDRQPESWDYSGDGASLGPPSTRRAAANGSFIGGTDFASASQIS